MISKFKRLKAQQESLIELISEQQKKLEGGLRDMNTGEWSFPQSDPV
ncbi:hypothetical protein [Anditalea andensis]|nr:hypothetical protein [Anditalea andensis]